MSTELLILSGGRPQSYNLYGWGENSFNQLGVNNHKFSIAQLTSGAFGTQTVTKVVGGSGSRYFLTSSGNVYSWGANGNVFYGTTVFGQLGTGTSNLYTAAPTLVMSSVADIDAYGYAVVVIKTDGTIWWWGQGFTTGGSTIYNTTPVQVPQTSSVSNASKVSVFSNNAFMYLTTAGTVFCIGSNASGRFGNGGTSNSFSSAVQITALTNVTKIATALSNGYAIDSSGNLWGWGAATNPGPGDNGGVQRNSPVQVKYNATGANVVTATNVYASDSICLFTVTPGTGPSLSTTNCYGFGNNNWYQLTSNNATGVFNSGVAITGFLDSSGSAISTPVNITQLGVGGSTTAFINNGGLLFTCGANDVGQAGQGNLENVLVPKAVNTSNTWTSVYVSERILNFNTNIYNYTMTIANVFGVNSAGQTWAAGSNYRYSLGSVNSLSTPTKIGSNYEWLQVVEGGADNCYTVAIKSDNTLWSVGSNYSSALGYTPSYANETVTSAASRTKWSPTLTQITSGSWIDIAAGGGHTLAIRSDNTVYGWGYSNFGQAAVGSASIPYPAVPTPVSTAGGFGGFGSFVSAGVYNSVVVDTLGNTWACGYNVNGGVGDNTTTQRTSLVAVKKSGSLSQLNNIIEVASGNQYSIALDTSGEVWGWGSNADGQLGVGTFTASYTTAQQTLWKSTIDAYYTPLGQSPTITELASGLYHTLARLSNGHVWACGFNGAGQLGDGSYSSASTPVRVFGLTDVVAIGAAQYTSYALQSNGTICWWGLNKQTDFSVAISGFITNPYVSFVDESDSTATYNTVRTLSVKAYPESIARKSPCAQYCQFVLAGG